MLSEISAFDLEVEEFLQQLVEIFGQCFKGFYDLRHGIRRKNESAQEIQI